MKRRDFIKSLSAAGALASIGCNPIGRQPDKIGYYYLTEYIGIGTSRNKFIPIGMERGCKAIDLRPDCTRPFGKALLWTPESNNDSRLIKFAEHPDEDLSSAQLSRIQNELFMSEHITAHKLRDALLELLRKPGMGWNQLRSEVNGKYVIYLGSKPLVFGGGQPRNVGPRILTTITESWDCTDSDSLTCDLTWTELGDIDGWSILSNQARWNGTSVGNFVDCEARADSTLASDDHYVQTTLVANSGSDIRNVGVMARRTNSATDTYYCVVARWASPDYELFKVVSGSFTSLATGGTPNTSDVLRLECNGSSISSKENGSATGMPSATDTSITGETYCGIFGEDGGGTNTMDIDDWSAGDLAAGGGVSFSPMQVL